MNTPTHTYTYVVATVVETTTSKKLTNSHKYFCWSFAAHTHTQKKYTHNETLFCDLAIECSTVFFKRKKEKISCRLLVFRCGGVQSLPNKHTHARIPLHCISATSHCSNLTPYIRNESVDICRVQNEKKGSYQHTIYSITATHIYNMCIEMISVYAIFH